MKKLLIAAAVLTAASVQANDTPTTFISASQLTEENLTVAYASYDVDGITLDGYALSGGRQFDNDFYLKTTYTVVSGDVFGFDIETKDLGFFAGEQFAIDEVSLAYVQAGVHFLKATADGFGGSDTENEFAVSAGYKRALTDRLAITTGLTYMDSEIAAEVGLLVSVTENIALSAGYLKADDVDSYNIGVKLYF